MRRILVPLIALVLCITPHVHAQEKDSRGVTPMCVEGCGSYGVNVLPDDGIVQVPPNSGPHHVTFSVTNTGSSSGTFSFVCSAVKAACGTVVPTSWTIAASGTIDVDVSFNSMSLAGSVKLTASGPATDTGTYSIGLVYPAPPTVALQNQNGSNLDRGLCLTSGAGEAAGISCGDLFVTHGMPAYRSLGRDRSLALIYNSAAATGLVLVAANVSQPAATAIPSSITLILTVGTAKDSAQFAPQPAGVTQQVVIGRGITGLATGVYPMTLLARNVYSGSVQETTVNGTVLVVNRSASEFGKGWALMGMEQVLTDPSDSTRRVWVAGDGSIRLYTKPTLGSNTFLGAAGDAPDSLVRFDTLVSGNTEKWYRRNLKHGAVITFDVYGRHRVTQNRVGARTTFAWNYPSVPVRLVSITVPPNDATTRAYSFYWSAGAGLLDSIKDPGARRLKTTMSGGLLTALADPGNQVTRFNYTGNLLTKRIYLRKGMKGDSAYTSFAYANNARVTAVNVQTDSAAALFATTTLTPWDEKGLAQPYGTLSGPYPSSPAGLPSRVDGPLPGGGDASEILVNRFGQPTQITAVSLNTTTWIYRDSTVSLPALVTRVVYPHATTPGAAGRTVRMTWNSRGNLMEVRDSTCRKLAGCSPAQVSTTSYQYNLSTAPDSPTRVTDALGRFTQYFYTSLGLTDSIIDARSHRTKFWYRASGPLLGVVDSVTEREVETWNSTLPDTGYLPKDQTTHIRYNVNGIDSTIKSPLGVTTSYIPDALGRIIAMYDPLGGRTSYAFDAMNRMTTTTRDSAKQVHPGGDPLFGCDGQQILCTDPNQEPTAGPTLTSNYYYGAVGLDSVADPRGVKRRYIYDARGNLRQELNAVLLATTNVYDQAGLLLRSLGRVDSATPHRDTVSYGYDAVGRRTSMVLSTTPAAWPVGSDTIPKDSVSYSYDLLNRLIRSSNRHGSILRSYYDDGSLRTQVTDLGTGRDSASYEYDASGARTTVRRTWSPTSATDVFTYSYKSNGDLDSMVAGWAGGTPAATVIKFTWDGLGRRHRVAYPRGITLDLRYDAAGLLRRQVGHNPQIPAPPANSNNFEVTYQVDSVDAMGRALRLNWTCGGQGAGSPCGGAYSAKTQSSRYDRFGWLVWTSGAHGQPNQSFRYDRSGNRTALLQGAPGDHYYRYQFVPEVTNNLILDSTAGDNNQQKKWITHNASGARIYEWHDTWQLDRVFHYDALGRMAGVRDYDQNSSGVDCNWYNPDGQQFRVCEPLKPYLIFDGDNVAAIDAERWVFMSGPGLDDPLVGLYRQAGTGNKFLYYYVTDGQGRQLAVGREDGSMTGNSEAWYVDNGGKYAGGTTSAQSFSASRLEMSSNAPSISYFRNRAYDQSTGRWLQEDPIGIAGGLNLYQFNGNNPVTFTDPFGLCPEYLTGRPCFNPLTGARDRPVLRSDGTGYFGAPRGGGRLHRGVDAAAPLLSRVGAADQGRVAAIGEDAVSGRYVIVEHANGKGKVVSWTAYMHLCEISVKRGQAVVAGQELGQSGDTGNAVGEQEHLHFEIRTSRRGGWLDAAEYFSPK